MIQARIRKQYAAGPDSAGFSLDLEFRAAAGVTVLFGSSGAGKTLTLDSIAGFVRPDEGRILLDDQILFDGAAGVHLPPRARHCGYVFQNYALFPHMTLRQNLEFAAERSPRLGRHRKVTEMLEKFHLTEVAGRRPYQLSGGQKQRCSIARALIGAPRVLLLDEPGARPGCSAASRAVLGAAAGPAGVWNAHPAGHARHRRMLRVGGRNGGAARRPRGAERNAAQGFRAARQRGCRAIAGALQRFAGGDPLARSRAAMPAACAIRISNWPAPIFPAA